MKTNRTGTKAVLITQNLAVALLAASPWIFCCGVAEAQSSLPWIDVTNPTYGAKCDGSTDDTAAIQSALTAGNAASTDVLVPPGKTCVIASSASVALSLSQFVGVGFTCGLPSAKGNFGGNATPRCALKFTGTPGIGVSAQSSNGVAISGFQLVFAAPSFNGNAVDSSHSSSSDTENFTFSNNTIRGAGTSCAVGISLDKTITSTVENNSLFGCATQLRGIASSGSYSNANRILHNLFNGSSSVSNFILSPGQGILIEQNIFEDNNNGIPVLEDAVPILSGPTTFIANWIGDGSSTKTYNILQTGGSGLVVDGNLIAITDTNATLLNINTASTPGNIHVHGNNICGGKVGTFVQFNANPGVDISAATYCQVITTFSSGTPASGIVTDSSGKTTVYGTFAP